MIVAVAVVMCVIVLIVRVVVVGWHVLVGLVGLGGDGGLVQNFEALLAELWK